MDQAQKEKILSLLAEHRLTTVATVRPDGWPQATTVGYANDGLHVYFICATDSQKAQNIAKDNRISLTVDHDTKDPMRIEGLSIAARAHPVENEGEIAEVMGLLEEKFPEYAVLAGPDLEGLTVMKVVPELISLLDYTKGFGHADLVAVSPDDLPL